MNTYQDLIGILGIDENFVSEDNEVQENFCVAITDYILRGYSPGGHIEALLAGDLFRAVQNVHPGLHPGSKSYMVNHTKWIVWYAPNECWGSYDKVNAWLHDTDNIRTKYVTDIEKKFIWKTLKR